MEEQRSVKLFVSFVHDRHGIFLLLDFIPDVC